MIYLCLTARGEEEAGRREEAKARRGEETAGGGGGKNQVLSSKENTGGANENVSRCEEGMVGMGFKCLDSVAREKHARRYLPSPTATSPALLPLMKAEKDETVGGGKTLSQG